MIGLIGPARTQAQPTGPEIRKVSIGLDGHYKTGYWTAVRLIVQGGQEEFRGQLAITVLDGDGLPVRHVWGDAEPIVIPANGEVTIERNIKVGRREQRIPIVLTGQSQQGPITVAAHYDAPAPLKSDRELLVTLGPSLGLEEAIRGRPRAVGEQPVFCSPSVAQLPESWLGYEAVDAVVMTTSDPEVVNQCSDRQLAALRQWVTLGGRLLLCVGTRGEELLAGAGRLAGFAPGAFSQVISLRNASPVETYSGSSQQLAAGSIRMTLLAKVTGKIELFDLVPGGRRPMVVRAPMGFGRVTFVAFDLDQPPFSNWEGRPRFVQRLLRESTEGSSTGRESAPTIHAVQFGYNDIAGQLRSAMDQFPGVTLVAFSWVAGLSLLYVTLIGPVDYFLLRDVIKRPHVTWLSFPLLVAGFVVLAVFLNKSFRGGGVQVNHLDLVDVDFASSTVRGTSWSHVYSPDEGRFNISLEGPRPGLGMPTDVGRLVAWHGLPGTALGGLDTNTAGAFRSIPSYGLTFTSSDTTRIVDLPLPVASSKCLLGRWWGTMELTNSSSLSIDADRLLRGELVNPFPFELTDCMVFFENWVYRLDSRRGVLAPGERTRIEHERALNLQWRLSGRRVMDTKDVSTPWDQNTLDVDKILEMMMFHGAVGGESYTHLVNRYQGYVDLSEHLQIGRAILSGKAAKTATQLTLNADSVDPAQVAVVDADKGHATRFRLIFPVESQRD